MCAVLKKSDLKVKLGGMWGIKGAVCASSRVVGSEEVSELQNKHTHIDTIKTGIKNTFMFMWVKLLIKSHAACLDG